MRRPLLFSLPVLLAAVLLAACGGDDDTGTTPMNGMDDEQMADQMDDHMGDDDHDEASEVAPGAREIEVTASSFAFDPDTIEVEAGEDVAIVLTSTDILHDFVIDDLDAHVSTGGGETATGGLRADEPGTYTFYCSVPGHREAGMEGTLVVEG